MAKNSKKDNKKKSSFFGTTATPDISNTLHERLSFTGREQYKILRANLSFTLPDDVKCPVIGVTSSMRGEGKSTTAINLSYALAESGKKVVLIDGDLRIPSVAGKMQIAQTPGVTNLLVGREVLQISAFKSTLLDNWYIIPSGELPPNPSELLGSKKMERLIKALSENFDYVIIDLPPVNVVSDAVTVSKMLTGLVLVVRENYATKGEVNSCIRQLKLSNVNVLGFVLNGKKPEGSGYGYRYKYNRYYKYYRKYYKDYYSSSPNPAKGKKD